MRREILLWKAVKLRMKASMDLKLLEMDSKLKLIRFSVWSCSYTMLVIQTNFIIHLSSTQNIMHIHWGSYFRICLLLITEFGVNLNIYSQKIEFMGCCTTKSQMAHYQNQNIDKNTDLRGTNITAATTVKEFSFAHLAHYSILNQAIDETNKNVKLIQNDTTKQKYILKYLLGDKGYINAISQKVKQYSTLFFAYLAPILQYQPYPKQGQMLLRLHYYPNSMKDIISQQFQKCDKLIVFYRIARAVHYLEQNGICHNKIELSNIFFQSKEKRCVYLGLPNWANHKAKQTNAKQVHMKSLSKIFKAFFPQPLLDQPMKNLLKNMQEYSSNTLTLSDILQSLLSLNFLDDMKTVDQTKKTIIDYEQGDHYQGQVDQNKNKEGYGSMIESQSKYWGLWASNLRASRGNFQCSEYAYVGQWKENRKEGFGLLINTKAKEYYEGYFTNGQKDQFGIWEGTNGQIYIGEWSENKREGYGAYYDGNGEFYYQGEWRDDKKNGKGKQVYKNGCSYEGEYKDNIKHGKGHYIHPQVFDYEGDLKENLITGFGTFIDKEGNKYIGTLINGIFQGEGSFTNKDGTYSYTGHWVNGQRHGQGQQKTKERHYIGPFVHNIKHGKGILKELNQTYTGEFRMGKVTGQGDYLYQNGDKYTGNFIDKLKDGYGVYISAKDNSIYQGYWLEDRKQGQGKHTLKSGEYYEGEWFQSRREGYGVHFINEQNKYEGYWKQNRKQGKGVQYQSGNKYEGEFKNGLKHSKFAKLVFTNGDVYEGGFVENKQEGEGKYIWSNGDEYIGGFVGNNRQGQGIMKFKESGLSYQGGWKNDQRQGHGIEKYKDGQFIGEFTNNKKNGKGVRTFYDSDGVGKLIGVWVDDKKHGEFQFHFPDKTIQKRDYSNDHEINLGMTMIPF